ncbi:MAG TPA: 3-ketoacyl-ACP reductase [Clostridia bacterium]|nr:MAG: 2-dehydro-3-deoxy-D-gluconate 5-dehydrogenase [Firmicutes bacterium ADurb.Bin146]HOD92871.1 3-ketoacyl-ACP reductase [Clostridia bacterium]HQM39021.1 3-ketoacyl-ACP reductase [Clostridia bacterium]
MKKIAIITGAARGIGNGIAYQLATEEYDIAILDVFAQEDVNENIDRVKKAGAEVLYFKGDLSKSDDRIEFVKTVMEQYGRIDVLVNNAGVGPKVRMDILDTTEESFDFVMNINLKGTFFLTQAVANEMIKLKDTMENYKPKIINISSMSAYTSSISRGEYCISKAGVSMVTKLFADKLAAYEINVYEIRPGIIYTPMTEVVRAKYDKLIAEGICPIKRWGYPEDIANVVSAFVSDKFAYSTGEVINVDGGLHIQRL